MSSNPERSRLAQVARLTREAEAQAAAGRVTEAVALLKQALRLDPADRRALHRLGELLANQLKRPREAARYFAAKARCEEREGFEERAVASWKLAVRCDPSMLEGHERIGSLYVSLGRPADARLHYRSSAQAMKASGRRDEAAILLAHLAAIEAPAAAPAPPPARQDAEPDDTAAAFAADRMQSARLFHYYGLQAQAREQLEDLLKSLPEHLPARELLVEVCRALGDDEAAAQHLRVVTLLLRRQAEAQAPAPEEPLALPPVEEWAADEPADPVADLVAEIRQDVERALDEIARKGGGR